jgi:hypothetical protein
VLASVGDALDLRLKVNRDFLGFLVGKVKAILAVLSSGTRNSHLQLGPRLPDDALLYFL